MNRARVIMNPIDPDDSEFLALAIRQNTPIWSHDKHFEKQHLVPVVKSADILQRCYELPGLRVALESEYRKKFGPLPL